MYKTKKIIKFDPKEYYLKKLDDLNYFTVVTK